MALYTRFILRATLLFLLFAQWITVSGQGIVCSCCTGDDCDGCLEENDPTGVTADKSPGLGVEFETSAFSLKGDPACSYSQTMILKGNALMNEGGTARKGTNWVLTVDTTADKANSLVPEYILDGEKIKIGQNMAGPAAAAVAQDLVNWKPSTSTPPMTVDGMSSCAWTISQSIPPTTITWQYQITAPMPLEAIGDLMAAARASYTEPSVNLLASTKRYAGYLVYVSADFFQSAPNGAPTHPPADVLGFFSLVLSYAKSADGSVNRSPKFLTSIMPRTSFITMFNLIKSGLGDGLKSGPDALYEIVKVLACYTWSVIDDDSFELEIDSNFCSGTLAAPKPNSKMDGLKFNMAGGSITPPPSFTIKDWMNGIQAGTIDAMAAGDITYDGQIGKLNDKTEYVLGTTREVPIFEFRNLGSSVCANFENLVTAAEQTIINYHDKYKTAPQKLKRTEQQHRAPHRAFRVRQAASACAAPPLSSPTTATPTTSLASDTSSTTATPTTSLASDAGPPCWNYAAPEEGITNFCTCVNGASLPNAPATGTNTGDNYSPCPWTVAPSLTPTTIPPKPTPTDGNTLYPYVETLAGGGITIVDECNALTTEYWGGYPFTYCAGNIKTISAPPSSPSVSVKVGQNKVLVGTLTSSALYTSISNALETLCPTPTSGQALVVASGTATVHGITYVDDNGLERNGELIVSIDSGNYSDPGIRSALIKSAASTFMGSANSTNCFNATYVEEQDAFREGPLPRDIVLCNAANFAGVDYYGSVPFGATSDPSQWLYPHIDFGIDAGSFDCSPIIEGIEVLLDIIAPEFAVEDSEIGAAIIAACDSSEEDAS